MSKTGFVFLFVTFALLSALVSVQCADFTVGVLLDSTQEDVNYTRAAVELALEDLSDGEKEPGQIKVLYEDVAILSPLEAVKNLHKNKDVKIFFGPSTSGELSEIIDYINENDLLAFSPTSTADSLALVDNVFRACPNDSVEATWLSYLALIVQFYYPPPVSPGALIIYRNDSYGNDFASVFQTQTIFPNILGYLAYNDPVDAVGLASMANDIVTNLASPPFPLIVVLVSFGEYSSIMEEMIQYTSLQGIFIGGDGTALGNIPQPIIDYAALGGLFFCVHLSPTSLVRFSTLTSRLQEKTQNNSLVVPGTAYFAYDIMYIFGLTWFEARTDKMPEFKDNMELLAPMISISTGLMYLNEFGDRSDNKFNVYRLSPTGQLDELDDQNTSDPYC